jgi:hypothetical protein
MQTNGYITFLSVPWWKNEQNTMRTWWHQNQIQGKYPRGPIIRLNFEEKSKIAGNRSNETTLRHVDKSRRHKTTPAQPELRVVELLKIGIKSEGRSQKAEMPRCRMGGKGWGKDSACPLHSLPAVCHLHITASELFLASLRVCPWGFRVWSSW